MQSLFDPFTGFSLVPSQDDWLGLTGRIQNSQPQHGAVQMDIGSGALIADADGKSWVLLRARTTGNAFDMKLPLQVADLLKASREQAGAHGAQLLAASGLLYAANGQQQATREMTWVGGGATLGILLLLLLAFRRWRVLLAFVPVLVGMLFGAVACVALFGHMHVMTLVLGFQPDRRGSGLPAALPVQKLEPAAVAQLAGIAPDPAGAEPEPGHQRYRLPGAGLDAVPGADPNCGCSPPPAWSVPICAPCACCPRCSRAWNCARRNGRCVLAQGLWQLRTALLKRVPSSVLLVWVLLFCAAGLWQLNTKNDIRQWIGAPPQLLQEAQAVARITGFQPTSQFFLVRASNQQQLLERQAALGKRLDQLVQMDKLQGYLALNQLVNLPDEQQQLREALNNLAPHWQPLLDLGVPLSALQAEVAQLQALPTADIDAALQGPLAEPWRTLWLGPVDGGVAAMVSLQGLNNPALLRVQALDLPGVQLVDRLGDLNRVFADTQISAAELKLLSCVLIVLLLIAPFGFGGALRIVALPLLAALCSLASLGWLGQPLTLFSLFGLLLVTAISVDYAILMREQIGGPAVSLLGTLLAALTTWLSFGLLAVSSTPAVSNFGLSVSLGLAFSFMLAPWAGRQKHAL